MVNPLREQIFLIGECKVKNNVWTVFSIERNEMNISLEELQVMMEKVVVKMRKRLKEYLNLDKGFSVLKWIGFEEDED